MQQAGKIVILGNSGFLGKSLQEYFARRTEFEILGYSSKEIDLSQTKQSVELEKVLDKETILLVLSGLTLDREADTLNHFTTNLEIAINVARCLEHKPVKKCVYFSTVSVYGDRESNLAIREETLVNPTTYYGAAKFAAECLLNHLGQTQNFPVLCVRLCRIYGPGAIHANYGPVQFVRSILEKKEIELFGDGTETREFLFIDDACRLIEELLRSNASGTFNLATGSPCSFVEMVSVLKKISAHPFRVSYIPRTRPLIDQRFDISKIRRVLPNFHFTPLDKGLLSTYEHYAKTIGAASS